MDMVPAYLDGYVWDNGVLKDFSVWIIHNRHKELFCVGVFFFSPLVLSVYFGCIKYHPIIRVLVFFSFSLQVNFFSWKRFTAVHGVYV